MTADSADQLNSDLALALELADLADAVSIGRFRAIDLDVQTKPDRSPVTEADLAVERAIRERLAAARPDDGILGEEFGTEGDGARQWIIDPIDGTANFLRGVPVWGTLISLAIDGVPVVGVASAPAMGRRWWAATGLGAWTTTSAAEAGASDAGTSDADAAGGEASVPGARRLQVSGVASLADASLSFQSLAQWRDAGYLDRLLALSERVWRDRAYGDLWSYMLLAEGLIDITGEFDVKPYDLAALIPIVEEAGGRFTAITGEPGPWHGSALATNGALHDEVLAALGDEA
ncbi:histidinol phosphatase [Agromyces sp. Root1464]|uniref:inositol monophosphatase family protein n=1 Tax=Agromyces sp. Root1464 TaxID=1736467 RepID=UPI0006FDBEE1|nr:inositol monophosphatase family protein [Agromyces sp. Root1464]KQZ08671.1 histidinol phosphatase [Agromyces sp. Root1464]